MGPCPLCKYRLLSHAIHSHVLDPAQLPPLLRSVRGALFPNNMPGKPTLVAPSSDAELRALRRRCASAIWDLVPKRVGRRYFLGPAARVTAAITTEAAAGGATGPAPPGSSTRATSSSSATVGPALSGASTLDRELAAGDSTADHARSGPTNVGVVSERGNVSSSAGANSSNTANQATAQGLGDKVSTSGRSISGDVNNHGGGNGDGGGHSRGRPAAPCHAFPPEDADILAEIEHGVLDVFGDAYCNKHLMYSVLELVLVRLMPELAEKGVIDLWEERLS